MRPWRSRLPTIAAMFMAWHLTAGAVVPLAMHALESSTVSPPDPSENPTPEVCEHHAMPGSICPMHSRPGGEQSGSPACAMVACDSAAADLFALLAWNGLFEPPVEFDAPLVIARQPGLTEVLLLDLPVSPTTPPPRV
jgi:hypothetical protein